MSRPAVTSSRRRRFAALVIVIGALGATASVARAQNPPETIEYYATDALGSVRVVFTATGQVIGRSDYLPFGDTQEQSGMLPRQRFTGQEREGIAGLDDFNARSLQMRTGRMSSPDPLFGNALVNPQRWNGYSYVVNNPLRFIDPSGMDMDDMAVFKVTIVGYYRESFLIDEFRVGGFFWGMGGDLPAPGSDVPPEPEDPGGGGDQGQPPPTPSRPGQPQPPPSQPTPDPCSSGGRGPRDWAGNLTDLSAGFGDGLLVVLGPWLRDELGLDEVVDQSSGWYETGSWLSFAVGFGRVAYAGLAKGGAVVASSGIAASTFRSHLKTTFRLGMGRNFRSPNLSKYPTDEALRAAAGRTNPYANVYGAAISAGSLRAATGCSGK